jgi:hypothetical protein
MQVSEPYPAMTTVQHLAQRNSWVVGELMLEHPGMTRDEAEAIYERAVAISRDSLALPVACG